MATQKVDIKERPTSREKGTNLYHIMSELFDNFEVGKERNTELANKFFEQPFFRGEESIIDKFLEIDDTITFEQIKEEGINLALLCYNNSGEISYYDDFRECINKTSNGVKDAFIKEIHDKVCLKIGGTPGTPLANSPTDEPYSDFDTKCPIPIGGNLNVLQYLEDIFKYLNEKEKLSGGKKTMNILKPIKITNEDVNKRLPEGERLNPAISLSDPSHNIDTKKSFDILLSFELGKNVDSIINTAKDISKKSESLFSNSFPAINTIICESEKFRYDEEALCNDTTLGLEYKNKLEAINENTNLNDELKEQERNKLRREYYLKYLKKKEPKVGEALQQLYNNNFNYSLLNENVLGEYLEEVAKIRLKSLLDSGLNESLESNFGNLDEFKDFYINLVNPTSNTLHLGGDINIPIKKEVEPGENPWLKLEDLNEYENKESIYDHLPITCEIKKSDIVGLPINDEDKANLLNFLSQYKEYEGDEGVNENGKNVDAKSNNSEEKYIIEGGEIGALVYLFFLVNSHIPVTDVSSDKQKEVEDFLGETKESKKENIDPEAKRNETENFINNVEKLGSGTKFESGSEIWLPMGDSELPGGGYQWMKIKIDDINRDNGTFTGKVFGGELKFGSKYEGKSKTFDMSQDTLDNLKNISKDSNKIRLLPNPDRSNFNTFKNKLNNNLGTGDLSFPEGVSWNGKNFVRNITDNNGEEKEEKVEYFGVPEDDSVSYKIKYNPGGRSFKVSCTYNGEAKRNDGKSENVRYSYSRDMDWNNFLIFFTQKGLVPQSKAEAQKAQTRQKDKFKIMNGGNWKLSWFGINTFKNVFKTITGNIKKKIDDYNKSKESKLEDILIGDRGLYGKLANVLGFIPSIKQGLGELEYEYYVERDNRSRKRINSYLEALQKDPDFGTTFDKTPPFIKIRGKYGWTSLEEAFGGKSYKQFIVDLFNNNNRSYGDENSQQAAALLLANIEKGGSPYRGLSEYENKGLRVKVLLGNEHYQQFLRDKAACINARNLAESTKNSGLDKKSLNNQLATCEMDYIINNVRGTYGNAAYSFGSKELRGLNGDKSTEYVDNAAKTLLSDQFANKLDTSIKGWFSKSSIEESYSNNKKSINSFEKAEDEFNKMGSSRYQKGAAALRTMLDYDSDLTLRRRAEKCFLLYLLCGALDIYCDAGVKKQVYGWAKPMSFVPGLLVKERNVADNVAILLDDATNNDFSKNVTKYFHKGYLIQNKSSDFTGLKAELNSWLTEEKMNKLHSYFEALPTKDFSSYSEPKKTILQKFQKALVSEDREETDRSILDNPTNVNNGLLTNVEVISNMIQFKDGEFDGKNSDDITNKKLFRKDVQTAVEHRNSSDPKDVNFVLDKYFSRFGFKSMEDRQNIYKWINTADYYEKKVEAKKGVHRCEHKWELDNGDEIRVPLGTITQNDVDKVLLYALEGKVWNRLGGGILPDELKNTLESFQKFFTDAFKAKTLMHKDVKDGAFKAGSLGEDDVFLLGGWDVYKKIRDKDFTKSNDVDDSENISDYNKLKPSEKKDILRRIFNESDNYINTEMENIYKSLKRKNNLKDKWKLSIYSAKPKRLLDLQRELKAAA